MNIALVPNPNKPDALRAAEELLATLSNRVHPDGGRVTLMTRVSHESLVQCNPQLVVVLGGDGSILATAHALADMRVPVLGINFGKLGYLAAYSLEEFLESLDLVLAGAAPTTDRLMLEAAVYHLPEEHSTRVRSLAQIEALTPSARGLALNDVVINAGDPFRIIELEVQIDEESSTTFRSDGLIVASASGSTGYNLSAGGPLISPEVEAMVLTPICPHTLAFRPVVLPARSRILIFPHRLNPGSRVSFDGQINCPIGENDGVLVRRAARAMKLVENPRISHWQMLAEKLHWARSPRS